MSSAQVELCHAYARAISALDMATLRTICAPDMTLTFFPSSFGVPKIKGIDAFLGGIQHVFAGTSERDYVIEDSEVMESEGRVWFFVRVQLFRIPLYMSLCLQHLSGFGTHRRTSQARTASATRSIIRSSLARVSRKERMASFGSRRLASTLTRRQRG
jgi:hypothetical protein